MFQILSRAHTTIHIVVVTIQLHVYSSLSFFFASALYHEYISMTCKVVQLEFSLHSIMRIYLRCTM